MKMPKDKILSRNGGWKRDYAKPEIQKRERLKEVTEGRVLVISTAPK